MVNADQLPMPNADAGLPLGWEIRHSNSKNLPYYFNENQKQSQWEPPPGTDTEKLKTFMAEHHSAQETRPEAAGSNGSAGNQGKIRASHFLVKHKGSRRAFRYDGTAITRSKAQAETLIVEKRHLIMNGTESFGEVAKKFSDCSSARTMGDLGFFGRGIMQKEFEEAAFKLKPGEISNIVETASGLHLIERLE